MKVFGNKRFGVWAHTAGCNPIENDDGILVGEGFHQTESFLRTEE